MDPQETQAHVMHLMATILPIIIIVGLAFLAFIIFLFWRIFTKAGLSGPLALLVLIPGIGWIIVVCILAFSEWNVIPRPVAPYYPPVYPPPPPPAI
jgi:uncharacterized membrane protein YhaH (DUF805 family)